MWSACAVMLSCFTITFEIKCAWEHVHCITRGITHAHISNTYSPAWRAVHMVSLAIYPKNNCTLWLHPSARTPHGTTHSTWTPNTSVVFTRAFAEWLMSGGGAPSPKCTYVQKILGPLLLKAALGRPLAGPGLPALCWVPRKNHGP